MADHWTIHDDCLLWQQHDGTSTADVQVFAVTGDPDEAAAYDALTAAVRAARLADDLTAVVRRYQDHWRPSLRYHDMWECDRPRPSPYRGDEPMSPGEVAALRHAHQQFCSRCNGDGGYSDAEGVEWPCPDCALRHAHRQEGT